MYLIIISEEKNVVHLDSLFVPPWAGWRLRSPSWVLWAGCRTGEWEGLQILKSNSVLLLQYQITYRLFFGNRSRNIGAESKSTGHGKGRGRRLHLYTCLAKRSAQSVDHGHRFWAHLTRRAYRNTRRLGCSTRF